MKESIGGSMLLYLVLIFVTVVMLLFSSILTYSKAYKIKNRIIEVIEKYGMYNSTVANEINPDLSVAGYKANQTSNCDDIYNKLIRTKYSEDKLSRNHNSYGYNYCIFKSTNTEGVNEGSYYVVVTFVEFQFPVIGDIMTFPVYGETKILGKKYDY